MENARRPLNGPPHVQHPVGLMLGPRFTLDIFQSPCNQSQAHLLTLMIPTTPLCVQLPNLLSPSLIHLLISHAESLTVHCLSPFGTATFISNPNMIKRSPFPSASFPLPVLFQFTVETSRISTSHLSVILFHHNVF